MPEGDTSTDSIQTPSFKPTKWWQWVLLYPALAISIFASIPTYVEAIRSAQYGVGYGGSRYANEQNGLWERNLNCAQAPFDYLTTKSNIKVDATICSSGDVLVRAESAEGKPSYTWVPVESIVKQHASFSLIKAAHASEPFAEMLAEQEVLCQRWIRPGRLLRRLKTPKGCFDEIVNTYTGRLESRKPAPCDPSC